MHLRYHVLIPTAGAVCWTSLGPSIHHYAPELVTADLVHPFWSTLIVFGLWSLLPDLGNSGYYIAARLYGRNLPLRDNLWGPRETRLFYALDRFSYWSWTYKGTHSLCVIVAVVLFLQYLEMVYWGYIWAYALGHTLHVLMDVPSHRISYIFWPLIPAWRSKDPRWDWWYNERPDA